MEIPKRMWMAIVVLSAAARLLPHPWNFTPIMAIRLFAGTQARNASTGFLAPWWRSSSMTPCSVSTPDFGTYTRRR
jgi:Family of unknown function (DUF6580)